MPDHIPGGDAEFSAWLDNFVSYANANPESRTDDRQCRQRLDAEEFSQLGRRAQFVGAAGVVGDVALQCGLAFVHRQRHDSHSIAILARELV